MRRVAVGEASQFDGVLHKGLPLRVLSDSDLLLKDSARVRDDIPDELAEAAQQNPDHEWFKQPEEEGEEPEGEPEGGCDCPEASLLHRLHDAGLIAGAMGAGGEEGGIDHPEAESLLQEVRECCGDDY